jgi:hypothetical protein
MAQSKEDLEYMGRKLQEEYSKWGFTTNIAKTKYISVGTNTNHLEIDNGDIITGCIIIIMMMMMIIIITKEYRCKSFVQPEKLYLRELKNTRY